MATITASFFMALDGVVDPSVGNWHFPYFNDEMGQAVTALGDSDVLLFGRVTYDSFAGAWPAAKPPTAKMPASPSTSVTLGRSSCHMARSNSAGATPSSSKAI